MNVITEFYLNLFEKARSLIQHCFVTFNSGQMKQALAAHILTSLAHQLLCNKDNQRES